MAIEVTTDSLPPTKTFVEQFGSDVGDNKIVKAVSAVGGIVGGALIGKAIGNSHMTQTGNPLALGLGALIGGVVAYKVIPEVATDIQRANQSVDQQVANGTSEGNLLDRFKSVLGNFANLGGQTNVPTVSDSMDVE